MKIFFIPFIISVFFVSMLAGCASLSKSRNPASEDLKDAASALTAVTGAISDKPLTEKQLHDAARKMRNDPDARSAVDSISSSFDRRGAVKYSPATGKRYSADMEYDPETGVKLLPVE